jgi:uncharacterized protein (TIGR03382 family)
VASCDGLGHCPTAQTQTCAPYACGATACLAVCSVDGDCAAGDFCDGGGHCAPKQGSGVACTTGRACTSGFCADGVCCDRACNGQCEACGGGTCHAVSGAPVGGRLACSGAGSCAGACDGVNGSICSYPGPSTSCQPASCANGFAIAAAGCDGAGLCNAPSVSACGAYGCGGSACKSACSGDGDCAGGFYCASGKCLPKIAKGQPCGGDGQCTSGFCTDGVCCDARCDGQCQACIVASAIGTCTTVTGAPMGTRAACAGSGTCAGACDGSNPKACSYPTSACRAASCSGGTATAAAICDGKGACPSPVPTTCAPFACGDTACRTLCAIDADCAPADYCDALGQCAARNLPGASCGSNDECLSNFCVDGVCCDRACNGQCEACASGTCTPVSGVPVGKRAACKGSGTCGGRCDGVHGASCTYPGASTQCRGASCANDLAIAAAGCDGAGACPPAVTAVCAPYGCNASACKTSCTSANDCVMGGFCMGMACQAQLPLGSPCGSDAACASGHCADGVCCNQACDGQCQACGADGVCLSVMGAPVGGRAACGGSGACAGTCDGVDGRACHFPAPSDVTTCGAASCTNGVATLVAKCDGTGSCAPAATQTCGAYVCGTDACLSQCAHDRDCADGKVCVSNACVAPMPDLGGTRDGAVAPDGATPPPSDGAMLAVGDLAGTDGLPDAATTNAPDAAGRGKHGGGCSTAGGAPAPAPFVLLALFWLVARNRLRKRSSGDGAVRSSTTRTLPDSASG